MEGQELRDGKARVKDFLIDPLTRRGMVKKPSVKLDVHLDNLNSIAARLAYMTEDNLEALAEVVERQALGPKKNQWPAEVSICNWARRLQEPPVSVSRLVRTYLQSVAGDAAKDGGYLVELFLHLRKRGTPPNAYELSKIRQQAEDNQSRRAAIKRWRENEAATHSDLAWLQEYMDTRRRVLGIIQGLEKGEAA